MIYNSRKYYLLPSIVISVLLLLLLLNAFYEPELRLKTFCEVYPKEKWILTWGTNGQIISNLVDYTSGHTVGYNLNQFERGEYISLKFMSDKNENRYFEKGDTVISMTSSEVEERIATEEGELEVAKANLEAQNTGEKKAMIEEAQSRLNYTMEKIKQQEVMFSRDSVLYKKELISQQEYESQMWLLDLLKVEKKIYEAQIENLSTGVKSAEVNLLKSQITSIESRLKVLRNRKNNLVITSPISGFVSDTFSPDTLLILVNDKKVVLHLPVKTDDIDLLKYGQEVIIGFSDMDEEYAGKVISISREVKFVDNQQVIFVSIELENSEGRLLPGMVKESFIKVKEISFMEYLGRMISS